MPRTPAILAITTLTAALLSTLPACTQTPQQTALAPTPFYVPTTLILQSPNNLAAANPSPSPLAYQVLAAADYEQSYFPRGEKFIYGSIPIAEVSSYSTLTYDIQQISAPNLGGYRYTWAVKSGIYYP